MRIALDVTAAAAGTTGVARYAHELTAALRAAGVDVAPLAVGRVVDGAAVPEGTRRLAIPRRVVTLAWRALGRPRAESVVGSVDVVHALDLEPPPTRLPTVLSVHDLAALDRPDLHAPRAVALQGRQLAAARRADGVVASSHATADALVRRGVDQARVVVVHLAPATLPPPVRPPALGLLDAPFVLAVGARHPRKRVDVLLEALATTRDLALVHAGPDGGTGRELAALAERAGLAARVTWLGQVDDAGLAWLYANAHVTCLPSEDEGFGLPVVEALAAGCPVVASDVPALREAGGDAVTYVPVGDAGALADAVLDVPGGGPARRSLATRARAAAARFSWAATARATLDVYERVAR